ncbi:DUF3987 domain-containing protein [Acinetobacter boissieri]|uniref:DUF3987 domain-containing protein n=1 Tax=Acinetobacter boissieri TaxID=1219383 RepID=A0A1G6HDZ7_9GAMM|nr:DUF3987 domain-containing protein [Acinetobacter boissieri]SDB92373.1 Protein of unknown function [Acinetobacter boissieri]
MNSTSQLRNVQTKESPLKKVSNHMPVPTSHSDIIAQSTLLKPQNNQYLTHDLIARFGSPNQPIHVDIGNVTIGNQQYIDPLLLPIFDGSLQHIQTSVLSFDQSVCIYPDGGIAKGFSYFGEMVKDQPIIITHHLEAFFKVASTGYAVVLVLLPSIVKPCTYEALSSYDFKQIEYVVNQLSKAGYTALYMPTRPEHIKADGYIQLEQNTAVKLVNQHIQVGESEFLINLCQEDDTQEVKAFLDEALHKIGMLPTGEWGELIPLNTSNTMDNGPYPINSIPPLARQAMQAIAEHVQAPIAMTAQCVIGAMSHIAQAKVNAPHPFKVQGEPCGLFLLTEGQSGSRKSTSRDMADRAIIQHERQQYDEYRKELEQWKTQLAGLEKKEKDVFLRESPPPIDPITRYSDITLEAIAGLYVDGAICDASISSDEAGQFFGGNTMKSDTRNHALGSYAKLFDDGSVERTRSKSNLNGSGRAYDVRLTFNLQGQHEVLSDALKDPVLRGQGFLPRFILTIPENLAGTRLQSADKQATNANLDHRLIAYWNRCQYLLDDTPMPQGTEKGEDGRYVVQMDNDATQIDLAFYNEIERLQAKGERYEYLQAFASRASQLARRLATVFAYFEGLDQIDGKTLQGACDVVRHSLGEWARYAEIESKEESNTIKLINWFTKYCLNKKISKLAYSSFMNNSPRPMRGNKQLLELALNELIDSQYFRVDESGRTRYVAINPLLLEKVA